MPLSRINNLKLQTELNALNQILSWFNELYEPQIPRSVWLRCELALAEGFTNAVRHAHKEKSSETPIDIEVTISNEMIEIRIWDCGPPFNLEERLKKMPTNDENQSGGGRGIQLIQKTTDHFSYRRTADDRNCLLMIKFYSGDSGSNHRKIDDFK